MRTMRVKILAMTMVAPVGVARRYEMMRPMTELMTERMALVMVTLLKVLKVVWAERVGKMMRLEMRSAPMRRMPRTIRIEHKMAKIAL